MIKRAAEGRLINLSKTFRSVAVVGPRQSGKTTLCRRVFPEKAYVSLENPDTLEFATADPRGFLEQHKKGAILDEIQRAPHLFSYLQIADIIVTPRGLELETPPDWIERKR